MHKHGTKKDFPALPLIECQQFVGRWIHTVHVPIRCQSCGESQQQRTRRLFCPSSSVSPQSRNIPLQTLEPAEADAAGGRTIPPYDLCEDEAERLYHRSVSECRCACVRARVSTALSLSLSFSLSLRDTHNDTPPLLSFTTFTSTVNFSRPQHHSFSWRLCSAALGADCALCFVIFLVPLQTEQELRKCNSYGGFKRDKKLKLSQSNVALWW